MLLLQTCVYRRGGGKGALEAGGCESWGGEDGDGGGGEESNGMDIALVLLQLN